MKRPARSGLPGSIWHSRRWGSLPDRHPRPDVRQPPSLLLPHRRRSDSLNILADRLTRLEKAGLKSRQRRSQPQQKVIYSLDRSIHRSGALVGPLRAVGASRHTPARRKSFPVTRENPEDGGPESCGPAPAEELRWHLPPVGALAPGVGPSKVLRLGRTWTC